MMTTMPSPTTGPLYERMLDVERAVAQLSADYHRLERDLEGLREELARLKLEVEERFETGRG